jgi:hypothetical protein
MRAPSLSLFFVLVLVSAFLSACDGAPRRDRDRDRDRVPTLRPCESVEECDAGELCVDALCRKPCSAEEPCSGARDVCDEERGVCVQCLGDADCGESQLCALPQGECQNVECLGDSDCLEGERCAANRCVEDLACVPNEIGCIDASTAFVCAADGSERIAAPCRGDQICLGGACRTQICAPSTATCSGSARIVCDATGTEASVESCEDACSDGGFGCTCSADACVARVCAPGSARCVGNAAQRCEGQGVGFGALEDCGQDSCIAGRCLDESCTPGARFCSGQTLLVCQQDGFGFDQTTCAEACDGADGVAQCAEQICEPLSQQCANATTLRLCNASGTETALVPCGASQACENGACVEQSCVPECGSRTCGPDPVCGTSCGSCDGTCNASGQCLPQTGPTMTVELAWTPTSQDMDIRLSRTPSAPMCGADVCSYVTCQENDPRPDWDGSGTKSAGDPLLDVTDIDNTNPEVIVLALPAGAQEYRVGAHNFGPRQNQTAATATATIRVRVGGTLVATHSRSVATRSMWDGVKLSWNGSTLRSADEGLITESFQCQGEEGGSSGTSCLNDFACPEGEGCVFGFPALIGTCQEVECTSNADCGFLQQCNARHACVSGPLLGWKAQCQNDGDCRVGFHCDFFTQRCEEACSPQVCTTGGIAGCCPVTGGQTCTADLFGISGNCDP